VKIWVHQSLIPIRDRGHLRNLNRIVPAHNLKSKNWYRRCWPANSPRPAADLIVGAWSNICAGVARAAAESFGVTVADLQRKLGALAAASPGGKARQA